MPQDALAQILEAAGAAPPGAGEVALRGADPVFRTRYRVGTAGAAAGRRRSRSTSPPRRRHYAAPPTCASTAKRGGRCGRR